MKIAQVCHTYYPHIGGIETHVQKISEHLKDFDIEVVCVGNKTETIYVNDIKVQKFKGIIYNDKYFFAPQIYFYLKNNHFDLIHGHDMQSFPSWFASKVNVPFVFTPHYHGKTSFGKSRLDKAKYIFYHSEHEKHLLIDKFNNVRDNRDNSLSHNSKNSIQHKLIKIVNGLDTTEFSLSYNSNKIKNRIIYTGRLEQYKNIHILIQTMFLLKDHTLEIVGRGPYESYLKSLVKELGLSDRITFIPYLERQEYLKHIKQAECFVNLSSNETYSISTTEALSSGTYCIVNRNTGMSDFIGDDCVGLNQIQPVTVMRAILDRKSTRPRKWQTWDDAVEIYRTVYNSLYRKL